MNTEYKIEVKATILLYMKYNDQMRKFVEKYSKMLLIFIN